MYVYELWHQKIGTRYFDRLYKAKNLAERAEGQRLPWRDDKETGQYDVPGIDLLITRHPLNDSRLPSATP